MKKQKRQLHHYVGIKREEDPEVISGRLAPVEEQEQHAEAKQSEMIGTIIVDAKSINVSTAFSEDQNSEGYILGLHPVVIVIVIGALLFIAFIAWQITLMTPPEKLTSLPSRVGTRATPRLS